MNEPTKPKPMSGDEIKNLSTEDLVTRMDEVRGFAQFERYARLDVRVAIAEVGRMNKVSDLIQTKAAAPLQESERRSLADAGFRFLLQQDLEGVSGGLTNRVIYGPNYENAIWGSPRHWISYAMLSQYQIIASRISLECFFDLLHVAHRGRRLPRSKSKFKAFKKWIIEPGNPYQYFVEPLLKAFEYDRTHRRREVHGTSRFAHDVLKLEYPDYQVENRMLELTNILLNVWTPLLQIMDGARPQSFPALDGSSDFTQRYIANEDSPEEFAEYVSKMIDDYYSRDGMQGTLE